MKITLMVESTRFSMGHLYRGWPESPLIQINPGWHAPCFERNAIIFSRSAA
ncbi:MAG: hypothetical protein ACN6OC_15145 [Alcaligenes sp.]